MTTNPTPDQVTKGTPLTYVPFMALDKTPRTSKARHAPASLGKNRWSVHLADGAELVWNPRSASWKEIGQ